MNREQIFREVAESAERFGCGNPQQFKLLVSKLSQSSPEEVVHGLLLVFARSEPGSANFQRQELAGRLLARVKPKFNIELGPTLRAVLPAYNPSIEQLPMFLAEAFGTSAVTEELLQVEAEGLSSRTHAAARTMRWWLNGSGEAHGA